MLLLIYLWGETCGADLDSLKNDKDLELTNPPKNLNLEIFRFEISSITLKF